MTVDTSTPRTRRAVIAASLGAVAALAAHAAGRPLPVRAADGDPVAVGGEYTSTSVTQISIATGTAIRGVSSNGTGLAGNGTSAGVNGTSSAGQGVSGASVSGHGVVGTSNSTTGSFGVYGLGNSIGVRGTGNGATYPGMLGQSVGNNTGVHGHSGLGTPPASPAKTGVFGQADQDSASRGVWGQSAGGRGVNGISTTGRGVHGQATSGLGVRGYATSGVGLSGEATTGYALRTMGRVRLDKSAGQATINSGNVSVTVTPGIDLTSTSAVVATLNGNAGGSTAVKRVAIDTTANTFTVHLTANATATVKVAWIVLS